MNDFAQSVRAEIQSIRKQMAKLQTEMGPKIRELTSLEDRRVHLEAYLRAIGHESSPDRTAVGSKIMNVDITKLSAAKAASAILFPDRRLTFDELYAEVERRGYPFPPTRARSLFNAALHSSSHIRRDEFDKYFLKKRGDRWWKEPSKKRKRRKQQKDKELFSTEKETGSSVAS